MPVAAAAAAGSSAHEAAQPPAFDMHRAAREGTFHLLAAHLQSAALATAPAELARALNTRDPDGRTVLHWLFSAPNPGSAAGLTALRTLLQYGAEVESKDESGWTPLMSAASAGSLEYVRLLLDSGASPAATNSRSLTALHYAASKGHTDVGRALLEYGAPVNARDGAKQTPLHRAASAGKDAFVRVLLAPPPRRDGTPHEKTRVNPQDRLQNTPLHLALESGHGSTAVVLIEDGGADRERPNEDGHAPEEVPGLGGQEQVRVRQFVLSAVGPR